MARAVRIIVLAAALMFVDAAPARGQFVTGPGCPPPYRHPFTIRGYSYPAQGFYGAGFAAGFYSRSAFVGPFGLPWNVLPPISTLTPFGWTPGFLPAGWGIGPGWGGIAPPVAMVQPPIVLAGGNAERNEATGNPALAFEKLPQPIKPLPRGARDQFIVISPKKAFPEAGRVNPEVDRVAAVPPPRVPVFRLDPFAKRAKVDVEPREADPAKEAVRLLALGRAAYAAGEYGRAADQFERAAAADGKSASARFLNAQAAFAAGRFADAVSAIRAGLEIDPAWPTSTFDPKEPYGANAVAFTVHLAELRKAVAANPGEPNLEFLLGYQLWFVGERIEAKKWLDSAAMHLAEPGPVRLFK